MHTFAAGRALLLDKGRNSHVAALLSVLMTTFSSS